MNAQRTPDYRLGMPIEISAKLVRTYEARSPNGYKLWQRKPLKAPERAIVVGIRTLSNGDMYWDSDAGYLYTPKEHFRAVLVCTSIRSVPIFVDPNDITEVHA